MLELRGEDVTMNSLWGIELGILGACLDWEVAWERNVGLLLGIHLGPVDLRVGTGWGDQGLQHIAILLLETGPEGGKHIRNNLSGSLCISPLSSQLGLGNIVHSRGGQLNKSKINFVYELVTFVGKCRGC